MSTSEPVPVTGPRRTRALLTLCVTEITSWGVLYYAFPVLAGSITQDMGWSTAAVTWAFSLGSIVAAVTGIAVGPWLDRHGPRLIMTVGSVLGVLALLAMATTNTYGGYLCAWVLGGLAMATTFYPPAFAALTRWYGQDRVRALTTLTLVGGLASTVFAPLTALLNTALDWRSTYLVLAVVLGVVTIPLHAGLRLPWPAAEPELGHGPVRMASVLRSRAFVALLTAMALAGIGVYSVVVNQVALLTGRGLPPTLAAVALGLGGLGQVLGRLGYAPISRSTSVRTRTVVVLAACATSIGVLAVVPGPVVLLIAGAMLAGMARGLFTLLQATAVSDRWGAAAYGRLSGVLGASVMLASALAPGVGAALAAPLGGYPTLFVVLAGITAVGAVVSLASRPTPADSPTSAVRLPAST